jgi:hypothetical protein
VTSGKGGGGIRSVDPRGHDAYQSFKGEAPNRRQKLCAVCAGMPDARTPHRIQDGQIVAPDWKCRGCGEPYAPPRPIRPGPLLYSSAGNTVQHGKLYGVG